MDKVKLYNCTLDWQNLNQISFTARNTPSIHPHPEHIINRHTHMQVKTCGINWFQSTGQNSLKNNNLENSTRQNQSDQQFKVFPPKDVFLCWLFSYLLLYKPPTWVKIQHAHNCLFLHTICHNHLSQHYAYGNFFVKIPDPQKHSDATSEYLGTLASVSPRSNPGFPF